MSNKTNGMFKDESKVETSTNSNQSQGMFASSTYEKRDNEYSSGIFDSRVMVFEQVDPSTILKKANRNK